MDDKLDAVQALFNERPDRVETGLDVDSAELLQLRKACRVLDAAETLAAENGWHTVVIELSFAAIERTLQFYLLENDFLTPDEYIDHETIYEQSHKAGLYNESFKKKLIGVWRDNRSHSYYRGGVGSDKRAETMLELAEAIHDHVLQLAGTSHECICD